MHTKWKAEGRWRFLIGTAVIGLTASLFALPGQFTSLAGKNESKGLFRQTHSHEEGLENYDIRSDVKSEAVAEALLQFRQRNGKDSAVVADIRGGFVRGEEELKTRVPHAKVEYNSDIRTPEVITPNVWANEIEWLSGATSEKRAEVLRTFVKQNTNLIGVTSEQAESLNVTADYENPAGNLSFAHLEQRINGIPVFRGEVKAGFTKDGRIVRVINNLAPGLDYSSLSTEFGDPANAVRAAAGHINYELKPIDTEFNAAESNDLKTVFGRGDWATTAEKMYFPTEPGVAVAAWRVLIWQPVNAFYVIVDSETGRMLWRKNITEDQTQSATYQVYRNANAFMDVADSPAPLSPGPTDPTTGTQGALLTRANVTLIGNEAPNTFNNNGWITDGANITDGNAVEAGIDRDGTNGVDAPQTGTPNRTFNSTWNPAPGNPAPGDDPLTAQAQRGAVIQMFYAMNRFHDSMYRLGWTEQAFNFQQDNFGRGGVGADRVSAEGQDSSGTNNANFSTPADGGRGRMQMFVWTGPTPDYDGTADAEVIIHEVTHGLSNRLHGNASGLSTNMARGMGEGWSDFYSYAMLAEPSDPINGIYTTGGYATFQITAGFTANYYYGIRRFPRAPITFLGPNGKPHNPYTFRYINSDCNTLIGTTTSNPPPNSAFPRGPVGVTQCDQVHNLGEVWSSALWEVRNRMVTRLGFTNGTTRALQVVTDGMKLAPIGPTFLQERDAIIAAAAALPLAPQAAADVADVREGFRVRGMGFSASIQTASPAAVTEAFDTPNAVMTNPFSVSDATGNNNGFPEPGESVRLNIAVTNPGLGSPISNVTVAVNGGTPVSYGTINDGATVTNAVPYTISNAPCGSSESVSIVVSSALGAQAPVVRSFTLGSPNGVVENFDGVTAPALPAGWTMTQESGTGINWVTTTTTPSSAPNSAFANTPAAVNLSSLVSPSIAISSASAQVTFRNRFVTEVGFDGMVLEIAVGAGTFQDIIAAGGSFVTGGYNGTLSTGFSNPLPGRQAWTGTSAGGYINTVVNLPASANGQNIRLRWRVGSDVSVAETGVNIDDVQIVNGFTCAPTAPAVKSRADFDGDGRTDGSIFRGSEGNWYLNRSTAGFTVLNWGNSTDTIVPGDFDGDGRADAAVFRPTTTAGTPDFWILRSSTNTFEGVQWGNPGDIPEVGDFDGDGRTDVAVFRPSESVWYIRNSATATASLVPFGIAGDVPVTADYNGDGRSDVAVFRPSNNTWYFWNGQGGLTATQFGATGDRLVPGDYDGDNRDDIAVFRPSTGQWWIRRSSDSTVSLVTFGTNGDVPIPGDYDGDGRDDVAVYRNGVWWMLRSTAGLQTFNFGVATDRAVPSAYIP